MINEGIVVRVSPPEATDISDGAKHLALSVLKEHIDECSALEHAEFKRRKQAGLIQHDMDFLDIDEPIIVVPNVYEGMYWHMERAAHEAGRQYDMQRQESLIKACRKAQKPAGTIAMKGSKVKRPHLSLVN